MTHKFTICAKIFNPFKKRNDSTNRNSRRRQSNKQYMYVRNTYLDTCTNVLLFSRTLLSWYSTTKYQKGKKVLQKESPTL